MQPLNTNNPQPDSVDRDVLITRLLDARAEETDWGALRDLASTDRAVWDEIIGACRQGRRLERGFESATAGVELSEVPRLGFAGSLKTSRGAFLGWAAAAVLALGLVAQQAGTFPSSRVPNNVASLGPQLQMSPQEMLESYIAAGQARGTVVGELPDRRVVETRQTPEGHEVFYVRALLERTIVTGSDFRTIGMQEDGRPTLVPAAAPVIAKTKY
ncbi:MAG: hypothetical protein AB7K52_11015 [Phycisphaerales bacterium]